jgi:hypothetical protein
MKSFLSIILGVAILAITIIPVQAQIKFEAGTGTDVSTTLCYYAFSSKGAGTPVIKYLNVTSDKASSVVQFYTAGSSILVTNSVIAGTNTILLTGTTSGFQTNDVIVIRSVSNDTYQRTSVSQVAAGSIVTAQNTAFALAAGDVIYRMSTAGAIPVGNATVTITGACYSGARDKPLLLEVDGTSACQINAVYAEWLQ